MPTEAARESSEPIGRFASIAALHRDLAGCRRCRDAGFSVESSPVVHGAAGRRAYLYGQAPGIVEGAVGAPWQGRAGRTLRAWLELDEDAFDATFYCASVTRCYPGRVSGRGDRTPSPAEQRLCAPWRVEGAAAAPPHLDPHGRRPRGTSRRRRTNAHRVCRQELSRGRCHRHPAPPPFGRQRMAQRSHEPTAAREGPHPCTARDRPDRRSFLTGPAPVCDDAP